MRQSSKVLKLFLIKDTWFFQILLEPVNSIKLPQVICPRVTVSQLEGFPKFGFYKPLGNLMKIYTSTFLKGTSQSLKSICGFWNKSLLKSTRKTHQMGSRGLGNAIITKATSPPKCYLPFQHDPLVDTEDNRQLFRKRLWHL